MWEARRTYQSDQEFGDWFHAERFDELFNRDERAALVNMGQHPRETAKALTETNRRSIELIWRREIQPTIEGESFRPRFRIAPKPPERERVTRITVTPLPSSSLRPALQITVESEYPPRGPVTTAGDMRKDALNRIADLAEAFVNAVWDANEQFPGLFPEMEKGPLSL
jgi:hypothetical protein